MPTVPEWAAVRQMIGSLPTAFGSSGKGQIGGSGTVLVPFRCGGRRACVCVAGCSKRGPACMHAAEAGSKAGEAGGRSVP